MYFAALDLGSNTVATLVRRADHDGLTAVAEVSECTRLGENLAATGRLQPAAMRRTLDAAARQLDRLRRQASPLRLTATGTSAVRDADNGQEFLKQCQQELGLAATPARLTGQDEAELTFRGATGTLPPGALVINLDAGGASTEITLGFPGDLRLADSLPAGCVRWRDRFALAGPFADTEMAPAVSAVQALLAPRRQDFLAALSGSATSGAPVFSATGGTATAMAAVLLHRTDGDPSLHGTRFTRDAIAGLLRRLASLPALARESLPGLPPGRGGVLPAGLLILHTIMAELGMHEVMVNTHGLRYGITAALRDGDPRLPVCLTLP